MTNPEWEKLDELVRAAGAVNPITPKQLAEMKAEARRRLRAAMELVKFLEPCAAIASRVVRQVGFSTRSDVAWLVVSYRAERAA